VAKAGIDADEKLFSIPRTALLDAKNSNLAIQHPDILKSLEGEPWLELTLVLLYENAQLDSSRWKPYFDILPAQGQFDTLMYWDDAELRELEASEVVNKIGKESADKSFQENIWPIVEAHPELFGFGSDVQEHEVLQTAHRMGSLIMAYAFDIESEREKEIDEEGYVSDEEDEDMPKAMVPLADMLNADADRNNARLFYEPDALVMKAVQSIAKGEEIFNDYGPLPRSDLLRRYGYITDNYAKYDVVEIPSSLIMQVATEHLHLSNTDLEQRVCRQFSRPKMMLTKHYRLRIFSSSTRFWRRAMTFRSMMPKRTHLISSLHHSNFLSRYLRSQSPLFRPPSSLPNWRSSSLAMSFRSNGTNSCFPFSKHALHNILQVWRKIGSTSRSTSRGCKVECG
jgi:hypothetical protein